TDGLDHQFAGQQDPGPIDLDGDLRADACIRTANGVRCATGTGDGGFSSPFEGPALRDDSGWADPSNYATMRFGDIDGDGRSDLCARANAGIRCWLSEGNGFGSSIAGPDLSDADGFSRPEYYHTLRLADVTGDGRD